MMLRPANPPTPGGPEAIQAGCICPVIDNAAGKGAVIRDRTSDKSTIGALDTDHVALYWQVDFCPLHGLPHPQPIAPPGPRERTAFRVLIEALAKFRYHAQTDEATAITRALNLLGHSDEQIDTEIKAS